MRARMTRLLPLCAALSAVIPSAAVATNGYFLIGFGAKSRAMGGVGVAYAQDGLAAAANPAAPPPTTRRSQAAWVWSAVKLSGTSPSSLPSPAMRRIAGSNRCQSGQMKVL